MGGGFVEQFLDDGFDVAGLEADDADDAFAVNDGVGRIVMHSPCVLRLKLRVARRRVFDAFVFDGLLHFFLATAMGANADDDESFIFVFSQQFIVVRDGGHAGSTPGGVEVHDDDFAFHIFWFDLAIDPAGEVERRHGFAFERGVLGASIGVLVPGPIVRKLACASAHGDGEERYSDPNKFTHGMKIDGVAGVVKWEWPVGFNYV